MEELAFLQKHGLDLGATRWDLDDAWGSSRWDLRYVWGSSGLADADCAVLAGLLAHTPNLQHLK